VAAYVGTGSYTGILNAFRAVTQTASVAMLALPAYRYGAHAETDSGGLGGSENVTVLETN
jgi:hypothetical protein